MLQTEGNLFLCFGAHLKYVLTSIICIFLLGGYNKANVARCWTYLTAVITGQDDTLCTDIPDNEVNIYFIIIYLLLFYDSNKMFMFVSYNL